MELTELTGIGPVRAETLRAMGIFSLRDLLYTLPVRYEDHGTVSPCAVKHEGFVLTVGTLVSAPKLSVFHGLKKVLATIEDDSGKMPSIHTVSNFEINSKRLYSIFHQFC